MSGPAPWAPLFHAHLTHLTPPTFTLSTLHHTPSLNPPYSPRARTCIFRGMFGSRARGAAAAASDLLTFTTDVRAAKVPDLFGPAVTDVRASGGGGRVEAVFWVEGVRTQWRVRGDAWVVGPDVEGEGEGAESVRKALGGWVRGGDGWKGEWEKQFEGMSWELKKGFAGPTPGEVIKGGIKTDEGEEADGEKAKKNFRVVAIRPAEVECVDLTDMGNSKRWIYTFIEKEGAEGEWKRDELNPGLERTVRVASL